MLTLSVYHAIGFNPQNQAASNACDRLNRPTFDINRVKGPKAGSQNLRSDAIYVYSAYMLRYLSVFFLVPYYGRVLGPATYGQVLAAMSLMALVWMAVNYGFSTTGSRDMALSADETAWGGIFAGQITARLVLLPVGLLIGLIGTILSPTLRADPWYGVIATLLGFVNSFNLGWLYQGLRRFRLSLIFEALVYPLNILFVLLLVRTSSDGISALFALLAATVIAAVSSYAVALRMLRPGPLLLKRGVIEIKAASTMFLQTVNSMVMTSGSTYFLSVFSSPKQVGYFGSVEKLVSFALAFLGPAAQVLMPTIAHRMKNSRDDLARLVRWSIAFEVVYGLCACIGGFFLARYIIEIAFGTNFGQSVPILQIMLWAVPFAAFTHSIGCYVLIPQSRERWLVTAYVIGNLINVALLSFLARSLGGKGVPIARVSGECMTALLLMYMVVKTRSIKRVMS